MKDFNSKLDIDFSFQDDLYLREWAAKLDVPILSVDYSLTPEAPFPRALEEVFYAYCWSLNNLELVGTTGENIIFVGDSAGGNLISSLAIQCIEKGIRKPRGMLNIYGVASVGFTVSPARFVIEFNMTIFSDSKILFVTFNELKFYPLFLSRFMSLIDPVLPYGFTTRLFKSYGEVQEKVDENDNESSKLHSSNGVNNVKKPMKKKKQFVYQPPEVEFNVKVHDSYLLSPYLAPDEILKEFPPINMLSTNLDPCLDDSIEFGRKLRNLGVSVHVDVLRGLAHGFLYFTQVSFS